MDVMALLVILLVVSSLAGHYHFNNCKKFSDEILLSIKERGWKRK